MAFLENLGKKIGNVAGTAADMASDFAETNKLNSSISTEQRQIDALLIEIGKLVFDREKEDPDSLFADQCKKILTGQSNIAELQAKIESIKGGNGKPAEKTAQEGVNYCPNCGGAIPENGKFCQSCGSPFNA